VNKEDAVRLLTRAFGVYLLLWTFDAASHLPAYVLDFVHHMNDYSVLAGNSFWRQYYSILLICALLRVFVLLALAVVFYPSGPAAMRVFAQNATQSQ
jgi:hypothetical protein